ncbi:DUF1631 family protein [Sinobacterium norvegicum]|uniref:DUF1631 family protein n=1 Tax=Sinobacterium norvegicum TaxID=1641715 RepID=UPI001F3216EE|nr:DUF1631 family protein [Sinobacterium norvegicum]
MSREIISFCRQQTAEFIDERWDSVFSQFDDLVFSFAEKAKNSVQQGRLFEAINEIRTKKDFIKEVVVSYNVQSFKDFEEKDSNFIPDTAAPGITVLELVKDEKLEDEIAITVMVSRANVRFTEVLWKLNQRLSVLRGSGKVNDDSNPCGPAHITYALRQAMDGVDLDTKLKLVFYKIFDKTIMLELAALYESLNEHLADAGVLANLKFQFKKSTVQAGSLDSALLAKSKAGEVTKSSIVQADVKESEKGVLARSNRAKPIASRSLTEADNDSAQRQSELMSSIRELQLSKTFAGEQRQQTTSGVSLAGLDVNNYSPDESFEKSDYALALSVVQSKTAISSVEGSKGLSIGNAEADFVDQLQKLGKAAGRNTLTSHDADIVDLVGMLFSYLLEDELIPDKVKALLSYLHTPYLKVALLSPEFVNDVSHPARKLLNSMAEAGARWNQPGQSKRIYNKLKQIVKTVLDDFVDDLSIFPKLLADFNDFVVETEKRIQLSEKRSLETERGLDRLVDAKETAAEVITQLIKGTTIPLCLRLLLEQVWVDYLSFSCLRYGAKSAEWNEAILVAKGLMISVQPIVTLSESAKAKRFRVNKKLIDQLQQGIDMVGFAPPQAAELLTQLEQAMSAVINGAKPKDLVDITEQESVVVKVKNAVVEKRQPDKQWTSEERDVVALLEALPFGTWFLFDNQQEKQLKLAWYSSVSHNFMFVNTVGIKTLVQPLTDLVDGVLSKKVSVVSEVPMNFMERALKMVLSRFGLKKEVAHHH